MSKRRKLTVTEYNHKAGRYNTNTRELPVSTTLFFASYKGVVLGHTFFGELSKVVESVEVTINRIRRAEKDSDTFLIEYQKVQKGLLGKGIYSPKDEPDLIFRKVSVPNNSLFPVD